MNAVTITSLNTVSLTRIQYFKLYAFCKKNSLRIEATTSNQEEVETIILAQFNSMDNERRSELIKAGIKAAKERRANQQE